MTREEIRAKVKDILQRLAPDVDLQTLESDVSLRKALTADSMDVLNFVVALRGELGVDVPEQDYGKIDTLDDCVGYLAARIAARATKRSF